MNTPDECPADFAAFVNLVEQKLLAEGYSVVHGEAQEWAAAFSLAKRNLDGNIAFFFGPEDSGNGRFIRYKLVSEHTLEGAVAMKPGSSDDAATAFVLHLEKLLYEDLQPSREQNPEVGRGLLSVSVADAQLDTIRSAEAAEEAAR